MPFPDPLREQRVGFFYLPLPRSAAIVQYVATG